MPIDCGIQPILGPSNFKLKVVHISYTNENPWHFGKPVLPLLMGLKLRGSRLICIRIDEPESFPE